jgi:hypothetical protein
MRLLQKVRVGSELQVCGEKHISVIGKLIS